MPHSPTSSPYQWHTLPLEEDTVVRLRRPSGGPANAVFVLLHGWTGDETFMLRFAEVAPPSSLVVSFRAPYPARSPRGGYSWVDYLPDDRPPTAAAYRPALAALRRWLTALANRFPSPAWETQHWIGFSQGASTAALYTLEHPRHAATLALLAGFLPRDTEAWVQRQPLTGKRVFIAHGRADTIVPLHHARHARALLAQAGAEVVYCEDDVAHKVSARCHKALKAFYAPPSAR